MAMPPTEFAAALKSAGLRRAFVVYDDAARAPVASHPLLDPVVAHLKRDTDYLAVRSQRSPALARMRAWCPI